MISMTRIPWHRRVGVRIGALVASIVLAVDLLSQPIWLEYWDWSRQEQTLPEPLRDAADALSEEGTLLWISVEDRQALILESLAFAVVLASIAAFIVSRIATRRLQRLAEAARAPVGEGQLPGPFAVGGRDEIDLLARSMNQMRQRVADLVQELADRDSSRREWIAQVSHDLRTPVTALAISLDRSSKLAGDPPNELSLLLAAARIDVQRMADLTTDLLEIARLDAGARPTIEPVPAGELTMQVVQSLRPVAVDRGVELSIDVEHGLPTLAADGRLLLRALENLVINSIQHAKTQVLVHTRSTDREILITVEDDGPGFGQDGEPVPLDELSLRRSRADSSGLGLKVARRVVDVHGGRIEARDRAQGGAIIQVALPMAPPPADPSELHP